MTVTINYHDIGFNSSSEEVETLRRAVEIRSLNRKIVDRDGVESYVWETPLANGCLELESVIVCEESGKVTYSRYRVSRAG